MPLFQNRQQSFAPHQQRTTIVQQVIIRDPTATSARVELETARAQVVSLTERLAAAAERLIEMRADLDAARAAERTARDEASNLRGELKALTPKCGSATQ